ncbi:MAG: FtsQ-type POTRA domain-containing protein [Deltaproteobacteria bacterium]|nr:FtsQ-type POTRA domain-containing protein [Deltaproteobacteria bacterium]MBN2673858.1 FtsQ-type POTRA domain-containing protein [Deltaproteobacteria bacterium]
MAVLACIAAVVWGGKLVYDYATTSSYFAVQHIEIEGNNRLSNAKVVGAAGFAAGDNIFSLDLVKVEHNLMMQPWIVNAKVRQQLPKTVIIDIVERKPEMLVLFDVPYLVDETGEIFKRWAIGDPLPDCVVTGISKREILEDIEGAQKIILDAISLRDRYYSTGNQRYAKLYEIHREIDGGFSLSVGDNPFYIKMGKPPFRKKLSRLAQLLRKIGKEGKQPQIVYFDNEKRPDRVTVKMKFSTENQ